MRNNGSIAKCPTFEHWKQEIFCGAKKAGMKPDAKLQFPNIFKKQGFVEAKTASTKRPIGPWAKCAREKRVGELYLKVSAANV